MKTTYKLDADDIKTIIAEHFNVNEENVDVKSEQVKLDGTAVGYKQNYIPVAIVVLKS